MDSSFKADSDNTSHEFVSDSFRPSSQDLEEVREGMKKLGLETTSVKGTYIIIILLFEFSCISNRHIVFTLIEHKIYLVHK